MPFQYKKIQTTARNRSNLDLSVIKNAIDDINKGKTIRGAALEYGIDRNTLRNYLKDRNKLTKLNELGNQFKTSQVFTIDEERALVDYLLTCSKINNGLTRKTAMKLANEYAKINSKNVPLSWTSNNCAGKDWFRGFMHRNPEFRLKTSKATSLSSSTILNRKKTNKQDLQPSTNLEIETNHRIADGIMDENTKDDQDAELRKRTFEDKLDEAYDIMLEAKKKMNEEATKDEFDIYAKYIATELRKVKTEREVVMAKFYINKIIMEARMGKYHENNTRYNNASTSSQSINQLTTEVVLESRNNMISMTTNPTPSL